MKHRPQPPTTDLLAELPDHAPDDVAMRRLRQRVLDSASAPPLDRGPSRRALARGTALVVAVAVLLGAGATWQRTRRADAPLASVRSSDGSAIVWSRQTDGRTEWIDLHQGLCLVEVRAHGPDERVAVRVPDGRIDDLGTVFEVLVDQGHTKRVRVLDGHVQLWLFGAPGVVLASGETWEQSTPVLDVKPTTDPNEPSPNVRPSIPRRRLKSAVTSDGNEEDAAYLRVLHLLRASKTAEARAAANDYLARFPNGFRRDELRLIAK
jgi:ferric-dicitrate binding protein FerR (iron transport regulator)